MRWVEHGPFKSDVFKNDHLMMTKSRFLPISYRLYDDIKNDIKNVVVILCNFEVLRQCTFLACAGLFENTLYVREFKGMRYSVC